MASHALIEACLAELGRQLPGDVVDELADGLIETYERQLSRGATPRAAAESAIAEFGDATLIAAAFARHAPARRAALALLVTGPAVGACWGVTLLTGHVWTWPIPDISAAGVRRGAHRRGRRPDRSGRYATRPAARFPRRRRRGRTRRPRHRHARRRRARGALRLADARRRPRQPHPHRADHTGDVPRPPPIATALGVGASRCWLARLRAVAPAALERGSGCLAGVSRLGDRPACQPLRYLAFHP